MMSRPSSIISIPISTPSRNTRSARTNRSATQSLWESLGMTEIMAMKNGSLPYRVWSMSRSAASAARRVSITVCWRPRTRRKNSVSRSLLPPSPHPVGKTSTKSTPPEKRPLRRLTTPRMAVPRRMAVRVAILLPSGHRTGEKTVCKTVVTLYSKSTDFTTSNIAAVSLVFGLL